MMQGEQASQGSKRNLVIVATLALVAVGIFAFVFIMQRPQDATLLPEGGSAEHATVQKSNYTDEEKLKILQDLAVQQVAGSTSVTPQVEKERKAVLQKLSQVSPESTLSDEEKLKILSFLSTNVAQ